MTPSPLIRFSLGAAATAGALVAIEVGLRQCDWQYQRGAPQRVLWSLERDRAMARDTDPYRFHPHQLWAPRPGARLPWTTSERFNAEGYRGPLLSVERPKGWLRLVTIGGAAALGVGVELQDTFGELTARLVSARAIPCESMNLGVEYASIRQSLERYRDLARPYRPHIVVLAVSTRTAYGPAPGAVTDDENIALNRPLDTSDRRVPPCVEGGARVAAGLAWLRDAALGPYWTDRDFQFRLKRLEPTARRLDWPGVRRVPMFDYEESLALLLQETRQDGAHLVLLVLPPSDAGQVPPIEAAYERVALEFGEREKLIVLDARLPLLASLAAELKSTDAYSADRYPSACGHAAIAETLAGVIERGIAAKAAQPPPPKEPPKRKP